VFDFLHRVSYALWVRGSGRATIIVK
jgi:hypothetical protein